MNKQPLWTQDFIQIFVANLFLFISFYLLLPTLPAYVTTVLGGDARSVGLVMGAVAYTAMFTRPVTGYLLDTAGRKKVLIFAALAYVAVLAGYTVVNGIAFLIVLRLLHGIAFGFTTTSIGTVAADLIPAARRGEGLGYYGMANTLAMAIGPAIGLFLLNRWNFHVLFIACFTVGVICLLNVLRLHYPPAQGMVVKRKISWQAVVEPRVLPQAAIMFFVATIYSGVVYFITLYGKELGVGTGSYFLIYAVAILLIRPFAGKAFDQHGPRLMTLVAFVTLFASVLALGVAHSSGYFITSAVLMGLSFGVIHPAMMAMAINRVPPHYRGAANATIFTAFDLGMGVGSLILGFLVHQVGFALMYLSCAFLVLVPLLIFLRIDLQLPKHHAEGGVE